MYSQDTTGHCAVKSKWAGSDMCPKYNYDQYKIVQNVCCCFILFHFIVFVCQRKFTENCNISVYDMARSLFQFF